MLGVAVTVRGRVLQSESGRLAAALLALAIRFCVHAASCTVRAYRICKQNVCTEGDGYVTHDGVRS